MSVTKIKLNKTVFNPKSTANLIDTSFKDLIKLKKPVNIKKFFNVYDELFDEIPKNGEKSHHELINQSTEYLNNNVDKLDQVLDKLYEEIEKKEDEISSKDPSLIKENIFYPNNTFLRTHAWEIEVINSLPQGLPIWVMQEGFKREFKNYETYKSVKKALGFDLETPDLEICEKVGIGELNKIPTGPDIKEDSYLNRPVGEDRDIDYTLGDILDYYSAQITCLEENMCKIKHYTLSGVTSRRNIDPGETIQVYYRKNDPYTPGSNDGMVWREGYMKEDYTHPEGTPTAYFNS